MLAPRSGLAEEREPQESDAYTRYELLSPTSNSFHIVYDVTAARPGATAFFNPIRKGSKASEETVVDRATGRPLKFEVVDGARARAEGLADADPGTDYIEVHLARPVPGDGGGGRIRIEKTYLDSRSYRIEGDELVFDRSLGIKRNAIVLPAGWTLTACNYPSQVAQEADGRLRVSFLNDTPAEAPLKLRARRFAAPAAAPGPPQALRERLDERARQTRDIVYFLQPPQTHAFSLYHDYTEERGGVDRYINVVRTGSHASSPAARNLDTGEPLTAQMLKGAAITAAGVSDPDLPAITPETEIVVFRFAAVPPSGSTRLRMSETYADEKSYHLEGRTLVFDRTFGRPANAVVLPRGWRLTGSLAPATVSPLADGRVRLDFLNPREDQLEVLITAEPES